MSGDLLLRPAADLAADVRAGELSARALVDAALARIAAVDGELHAFLEVAEDAAAAADRIDARIAAGEDPGALAGVPVAVKSNICRRGALTNCASRILENFRPPYDATVVARLREAGAVIIGATNMDEFAMGSSTENSAFARTCNPYDLERVPGGSSGGSAAAVGSGEVPLALGSDTGGSIRQPAAFCGCVGMKPTYGTVSRYGLVAFASSLDQIGPLAGDVRSAAALYDCIAGHDPLDSTSAPQAARDGASRLDEGAAGLRVGIVAAHLAEGVDPAIVAAVRAAADALATAGATVEEVELPHTKYAVATYYVVATAEASSNLARYDGVQYGLRVEADDIVEMYSRTREAGFGDEVKRRIMLGTYALSSGYYDAYYLKAQRVRTLIRGDFDAAFENVDVILSPTTPTPPFRIGEKTDDPLTMYLSDIFTISANLAGIPAISVPVGGHDPDSADGIGSSPPRALPVAVQLMARPFDEAGLFRAAAAVESLSPWERRRP